MRKVCKILTHLGYEILMVDVGSGMSFGDLTVIYLNRIKEERGLFVMVGTEDYGEKTASEYSSFVELKFASDYGLDVLPLRLQRHVAPSSTMWPVPRI